MLLSMASWGSRQREKSSGHATRRSAAFDTVCSVALGDMSNGDGVLFCLSRRLLGRSVAASTTLLCYDSMADRQVAKLLHFLLCRSPVLTVLSAAPCVPGTCRRVSVRTSPGTYGMMQQTHVPVPVGKRSVCGNLIKSKKI